MRGGGEVPRAKGGGNARLIGAEVPLRLNGTRRWLSVLLQPPSQPQQPQCARARTARQRSTRACTYTHVTVPFIVSLKRGPRAANEESRAGVNEARQSARCSYAWP